MTMAISHVFFVNILISSDMFRQLSYKKKTLPLLKSYKVNPWKWIYTNYNTLIH